MESGGRLAKSFWMTSELGNADGGDGPDRELDAVGGAEKALSAGDPEACDMLCGESVEYVPDDGVWALISAFWIIEKAGIGGTCMLPDPGMALYRWWCRAWLWSWP